MHCSCFSLSTASPKSNHSRNKFSLQKEMIWPWWTSCFPFDWRVQLPVQYCEMISIQYNVTFKSKIWLQSVYQMKGEKFTFIIDMCFKFQDQKKGLWTEYSVFVDWWMMNLCPLFCCFRWRHGWLISIWTCSTKPTPWRVPLGLDLIRYHKFELSCPCGGLSYGGVEMWCKYLS